jgi:diguanylate cyclase (GGDEF)-like protein
MSIELYTKTAASPGIEEKVMPFAAITAAAGENKDYNYLFKRWVNEELLVTLFPSPASPPVVTPLMKDESQLAGYLITGSELENASNMNIRKMLETISNNITIVLRNATLYELAITDGLTKLYVRRHALYLLQNEIRRAIRYNNQVSLVMFDLDHFKKVNDTYGHQIGDVVLHEFSRLLKKNMRETDIPARYGGEEFSVVARNTDAVGAAMLGERLRKAVEAEPFTFEKQPIKATISVGVATLINDNFDTPQDMIAHADICLYKSKEGGRNRVTADPYVRTE